ncbi:MAG: V-type ATP synthase subunit A [Bacteroidia bacterium]
MTKGIVTGLIANLLRIKADGAVRQNEICYLHTGGDQLMAEVIKIEGETIFAQVYDSTRGSAPGDEVHFTGQLLSVKLGPGMLSKKYDGLQTDLDALEGVFLKRGQRTEAVDTTQAWPINPLVNAGDQVRAGDWLAETTENGLPHRIMVPFALKGKWTLNYICPPGNYPVTHTIARLEQNGREVSVNMLQDWPVRLAVTAYHEKLRPGKMMITGVRTIDTLNPMLEGGTGFIPGPFGSGKTVLQQAIARQADADIVIIAACGERANEVVEIFHEFPQLDDPTTGRKLMERTIIIANTSNMPVAAREASVYTSMSLAEYYRSMGLRVLLLADSTSRWAQALREMSNRLEDLPGPDAFPMDLSATIAAFYGRAGKVVLNNGQSGAITFIGTVSPAGGNLKEPVTEATKKAARCFYALAQRRADSKRYPAIDPIDSYSKYLEYPEFAASMAAIDQADWIQHAIQIKNILLRGREAADQINILGDDGVQPEFHLLFWRAELLDFVLLQQDAFDDIDKYCPTERQAYMTRLLLDICTRNYQYGHFSEVRPHFNGMINACKQMNYSPFASPAFELQLKKLNDMAQRYLNTASPA